MPTRHRDYDDMNSSCDESGDPSVTVRTRDCSGRNYQEVKRSCAVLLPTTASFAPCDYAPCLLSLPGCHDSALNRSRLNTCILLGLPPQLLHWLAVEFGPELLCCTLDAQAECAASAAARSSYFVERFRATCTLAMLQKIPQTSYSALCDILFSRHGNDSFVRCVASVILHCCPSEMKCSASVYHGSRSKQVRRTGQGLKFFAASASAGAAAAAVESCRYATPSPLASPDSSATDAPLLILVTCSHSGRKFIFASPLLCDNACAAVPA